MHTISVSFHATISRFHFFDAEKAKAAYTKASEAVKEYQRYKNDRLETVEIETESGVTTLKLERIDAISINDDSEGESMMRYNYGQEALARKVRSELGLPTSDEPATA